MALLTKLSQLLGLLVELNNAPQIPKRLRYDLTPASAPKDIAKTAQNLDEEAAHEALRSARDRVQKGEMTTSEYESMQSELLNTALFAPSKKYSSLMKIARVVPKPIDSSELVSSVFRCLDSLPSTLLWISMTSIPAMACYRRSLTTVKVFDRYGTGHP